MDFETGIIREECEGSQLKYTMIPRHSVWCCVSNVVIRRAAYGDKPFVNDLTTTCYDMRDEYGDFELGYLRRWTTHLYDGNRGEDWSKYKATSKVELDGKALRFDIRGRYSLRNDSHTNLVLLAGGNPAMTVAFHGMNTDVDSFHVTSFSNRNGTVTIDFTIDADGYNPAYVGVNAKDDLMDEWTAMLPSEFTVSGYKVTIPNQSGFAKFYQLTYNGEAVTEMLEVRFRGNVIIEDALIVNGTNYIETISALVQRISALESQLVGLENALHAINTGN